MGRKRKAGLLLALALFWHLFSAQQVQATQLFLNELLESTPHIQVMKEGQVMRTVELKLGKPAEPQTAPAPLPQKRIALTFDDGPDLINTPQILDILRDEQVSATFFVLGQKVERYPEMTRRISLEGDLVANHSRTHPDFAELSNEEILALELDPTSKAVEKDHRLLPMIMRPPTALCARLGNVSAGAGLARLCLVLGYLRLDSSRNSPEEIIGRIKTDHHNGAIVLMHCNGPTTIQALPEIIRFLRDLGYHFVTVDQL